MNARLLLQRGGKSQRARNSYWPEALGPGRSILKTGLSAAVVGAGTADGGFPLDNCGCLKVAQATWRQTEIHFWRAEDEKSAREIARESSCYIRVKNVSKLFEDLKDRNAKFRYELTQMPWGMNEMQIDDPYGNAIKFGEPL